MNIIIHFIDIISVLKLSYIIPDRIICKINKKFVFTNQKINFPFSNTNLVTHSFINL